MSVVEHVEKNRLLEIVIIPEHAERKESNEFRRTKKRLREDGHYKCWISGRTDNLQVHHIVEWSLADCVDFEKLKEFLMEFDPYGYSWLLKRTPITNIDDIRNMIVLNQEYHTGINKTEQSCGIGIHEVTFPVWIIQKVCKPGYNPVPQKGETVEDVMERID